MLNKVVFSIACALVLPSAEAVELGDAVQAHGFFSQSLVHTSNNRFGGASDDGVATEMREIGGNLSWRPGADWLVSGQVLARWAGQSDKGDLRLDYGFVDHTLLADHNSSVGLRLGKIKNPYGFFNTTRDVAHTRPGIIMPQSIYLDRIRNFFLAATGASLYGNHVSNQGNLSWQISALHPEVDDPSLEYVFLLGDKPGHFEGKNSWLSQVMFDMGGDWRVGLSLGEMNMRYRPGSMPPLDELAGSNHLPTWVLSMERNTEKWSFTAEYGNTKVDGRDYLISNSNNTTESWYLQATRRFGEGWQGFLRYDVTYFDKRDRNGNDFAASTGTLAYNRFAKDWAVGLRRDIGPWALSGEWHHVDGTAWLSPTDTPVAASTEKWDLLLLQAAWYF